LGPIEVKTHPTTTDPGMMTVTSEPDSANEAAPATQTTRASAMITLVVCRLNSDLS
jgi:hypothetical protein